MVVEGIVVLTILAWWRSGKPGVRGMTPERKRCYDAALRRLKDPHHLNAMADLFEKHGCAAEATVLRIRAKNGSITLAEKEARKAAFRKGMSSTNPDAVETLAKLFYERYGAIGAADSLRSYARGLRAAGRIPQPNEAPPPPPPGEGPPPAPESQTQVVEATNVEVLDREPPLTEAAP